MNLYIIGNKFNSMGEENNLRIDLVSFPKKSFWKLSMPIMCFVLFNAVYGIIDLFWVSKLDASSFYAVSVSIPFFTLICSMGDSIGQGTNSLLSRSIGANDYNNAYKAIFHGAVFCIAIWILIVACTPFLDDILIFSKIDKCIDLTLRYLLPTCLFSIFFIMPNFFSESLQAEGDSKRPTIIIICGNILNLILDPILIFYLNMGVEGAAYATIVSSFITVVVFIYLYASKKTQIPLPFRYTKLNKHIFFEIANVAFPNFLIDSLFCSIAIFINGVLLRDLGQIGVLLYSTSIKLQDILLTPIIGYGRGLMSVAGQLFGSKKLDDLKMIYVYALKVSIATVAVIAVLFIIFRNPIYSAFSINGMRLGITYIAVFGSLILLCRVFLTICSKMLDAFGKSYYNLAYTIIYAVLQIVFISVLDLIIPYGSSVLFGILLAQIIISISYVIFLEYTFRKFKKQKEEDTLVVI